MYYVLYNPLSKNGKNPKLLNKIEKKLKKKGQDVTFVNIIEANQNKEKYVELIHRTDVIVVVGGDGTLHRFCNALTRVKTNGMKMYLYRGGTGNDFGREFKGKYIDITDMVDNLPRFKCKDREEIFINCSGFGLDGSVCDLVNRSEKAKKGFNYIKSVLNLFKTYKRYELEVEVDGVTHYYKNVWFSTVMNGKYFGGGMKLSPTSNRFDKELELFVIHDVKPWQLLLVFPLIFIGKHMWFKKLGITKIVGKSFKLKSNMPVNFQTDGEVRNGINSFECTIR